MTFLNYHHTIKEGKLMKQVLFIAVIIVLIPCFIVSFFMETSELEFDLIVGNVNVRVKRETSGLIEVVPLEEYIVGVLAGEMPVNFHLEALKAQAVAARSYVLKRMIQSRQDEYDVIDTVAHQVYLDLNYLKTKWQDNYVNRINKLRKAVFDTKGEFMVYEGAIVDALYFSTSNGFTEDSEAVFSFAAPYLRSVESLWDETASPVFKDQKVYKADAFYQQLGLPYNERLTIDILEKTNSGRISQLKINNHSFTGRDIRALLQIRSTDFEIIKAGKLIYINTKGFGHGVGMSQYGANGMALSGSSYLDILNHYYQGIIIKKL
jgi:stage II sporulation protein D